jgi:pyridoxine 5-phosphate synthase
VKLSINIDHIATIRQARGGMQPDPVLAAQICEEAGADGIVCHLREDRRHIIDQDVVRLRQTVKTKLDLEMAATPEIISIAVSTHPELVTLVPEKRHELTTEGGLDVVSLKESLRQVVTQFHNQQILVSLFIDPVRSQIEASKEIGSDMIEIHTGEYANAQTQKQEESLSAIIREMADFGKQLGLGVNAGHGLNYQNIKPIARVSSIDEISIGHAIIARAVFVGLHQAVQEMIQLVR